MRTKDASDENDRLKEEINRLQEQQNEARKGAVFGGMNTAERLEYDERSARIKQLLQDLEKLG